MWYLENELYHHGIKGQQWGIRRYQNPDGSYTEEGKKRYGIDSHGHASVAGTGRYFKDKYSGMSALAAKLAYKKDAKAYEKDYRQEMGSHAKTKEGRREAFNRLREKYGNIEFDAFESARKERSEMGRVKIAAISALGIAALTATGIAAVKTLENKTFNTTNSNNSRNNTSDGYGRYMGNGMYSENAGNRQKSTVQEFQERLKRERQRAANEQSRRNWAE